MKSVPSATTQRCWVTWRPNRSASGSAVADRQPARRQRPQRLYNWVFARHYGGTFVLRVEDTDAERNLAESYQELYDSLSWLGLEWDEGPVVGGPYGPYLQSERRDIYDDVVGSCSPRAWRTSATARGTRSRPARRRAEAAGAGTTASAATSAPERVAELEARGRRRWSG